MGVDCLYTPTNGRRFNINIQMEKGLEANYFWKKTKNTQLYHNNIQRNFSFGSSEEALARIDARSDNLIWGLHSRPAPKGYNNPKPKSKRPPSVLGKRGRPSRNGASPRRVEAEASGAPEPKEGTKKSLEDKVKDYRKTRGLGGKLRVFSHPRLDGLGNVLKRVFKDEGRLGAALASLKAIENKLLWCFLRRKKFIFRAKAAPVTLEKLRKYARNYKCSLNAYDKERLVFKLFDVWIKKQCFARRSRAPPAAPKRSLKAGKRGKHREVYLKVFDRAWVEDPVNNWSRDAEAPRESRFAVPVDINKVPERNGELKKFGRLFFASFEANKSMKSFLRINVNSEESFFLGLVKDRIEVKVNKKIAKFHRLLRQVRGEDQHLVFQWFQEDILSNNRSKLPTLLKDALEALKHFRKEYPRFLQAV